MLVVRVGQTVGAFQPFPFQPWTVRMMRRAPGGSDPSLDRRLAAFSGIRRPSRVLATHDDGRTCVTGAVCGTGWPACWPWRYTRCRPERPQRRDRGLGLLIWTLVDLFPLSLDIGRPPMIPRTWLYHCHVDTTPMPACWPPSGVVASMPAGTRPVMRPVEAATRSGTPAATARPASPAPVRRVGRPPAAPAGRRPSPPGRS